MKIRIAIPLLLIFIWPQLLWALTGREIMEQSDKLTKPKTVESNIIMKIYKGKRVEEKAFTLYAKDARDDEDKTLLSFHKPTRIQLLTHAHKGRTDDQWLVLSSGRVKRIASGDKGKAFVHSHFYYADLSSRNIDDYNYTYLGDEKMLGMDCYKVESSKKAADEKIYDKKMLYVRKSDYYVIRIDFYQKGKLHKYIENKEVKTINGILTPLLSVMSLADGKGRTELHVEQVKYNINISDTKFNKEALR